MLLLCIDPGHGGADTGAVGNNLYEKDLTLDISLREKVIFERLGHTVVMTRNGDYTVPLDSRTSLANEKNVQVYVSNHINAGGGKGVEVWHSIYGGKGQEVAEKVVAYLAQTGLVNRGAKSREGSNGDYYFVIRETNMPAIIAEMGFIDNVEDAAKLKDENFRQKCAEAVVRGTLEAFGYSYDNQQPPPVPPPEKERTPIMGLSKATAAQMEKFLNNVNPDAPKLANIYLAEGRDEGVKGDLAFAQSILETNYFRFTGVVKREQNNFAGLGATDSSTQGAFFPDETTGIRAQIQHLKAYASKEPLNKPLVDPRFNLVERGIAPNIEDLNGRWALPGENYGEDIAAILNKIISTVAPEPNDPGDPTDPGNPGDPNDPGNPGGPGDPGNPSDPGSESENPFIRFIKLIIQFFVNLFKGKGTK